ncbi:hypothetical protein Val02_33660 [Virgisporangium aliadipatigenens]|uniref:HTH cro/C1-type domain-containing protein n=1 Tax=Virgisporangium aliadipatigenens TaxID=741659 RepID=A0A8J4DPZ1_9ACTN|nr:hypothetical protein Val02_33660 [Virgisporangium aliadipatigenens]
MTQEQLADRSGVSSRTIGDLEGGRVNRPHRSTVALLADALGLAGADRAAFERSAHDAAWADEAQHPVPRALPRAPAPFVGRDDEVDALDAAHERAAGAPVVIAGMAGIGKSALAVHWAHRIAAKYPDGQLFVDLRGYDPNRAPLTPQEAVGQLLTQLEGPDSTLPSGFDEQVARYRSRLAGTRTLVLLDNAASSDQVRPLLPGNDACAVVVTGRVRLDGLVALDGARTVSLRPLTHTASVALIRAVAGTADDEDVDQLASLCGYLPLALRVAAARLAADHEPAAALVSGDLGALAVEDDNVGAVFDTTYRALSPELRHTLALLGLPPGDSLSLEAIAALVGTDHATARERVLALCDSYLLGEARPGRYGMHDLVVLYARRLAGGLPEPERRAALRRLLDFYVTTALAADTRLRVRPRPFEFEPAATSLPPVLPDRASAMAWFADEYPTIVALLHHARTDGGGAGGWGAGAWRLTYAMNPFVDRRFLFAEWIPLLEEAVRAVAAEEQPPLVRCAMLNLLGIAHGQLGRHEEALPRFEESLRLCDPDNLPRRAAYLTNIGTTHSAIGDHDRAIQAHRAALLLRQQVKDPRGEAYSLLGMAESYRRAGLYADAFRTVDLAMESSEQRGDRETQSLVWRCRAETAEAAGDPEAARISYERWLATAEALADRSDIALAHHGLGRMSAATDPARARVHLRYAHRILTEIGHPLADEVAATLRGVVTR